MLQYALVRKDVVTVVQVAFQTYKLKQEPPYPVSVTHSSFSLIPRAKISTEIPSSITLTPGLPNTTTINTSLQATPEPQLCSSLPSRKSCSSLLPLHR